MKLVAVSLTIVASLPNAFAQCEVQKLVPGDGQAQDIFGRSVAVSGDYAFVGQPGLSSPGSVYVYRRGSGGWVRTNRLFSPSGDPFDGYADTVAISGDTAIVGAEFHDHGSALNAGTLYVYERTPAGWTPVQRLVASDAATGDYLGMAIDIDGDIIVSGSGGVDVHGFVNAGAAYVFERTPAGWVETAKLFASDAAEHETFGRDVGVFGDVIAVGEDRDDDYRGAVFVFERTQAGAWNEVAKLSASDGAPDDFLGMWLDVGSDVVIAGAPGADDDHENEGAAYVFARTPTGWAEVQKLVAEDTQENDNFGWAIDVDGDTALVSTFESNPTLGPGSVHVYRRSPAGWAEIAKLRASDGALDDAFGTAIDLDGSTAFIGALWDDDNGNLSGSAYVFDVPVHATPYGFCSDHAPCGNATLYAGCANATGEGAQLRACGSASLAADDLAVTASGLPPGTPAVLFAGSGRTWAPFGDGVLAVDVSGGLRRYATLVSGAGGAATWGPALFAASGVQPGATGWFQVWYADPGGPCGAGANLSNGLRVSFQP